MQKVINKTVNLSLVGLDGNDFNLMAQFSRQAKKEGWSADEINQVLEEAKSSDYDHLVATLDNHCEVEDE